MSIMTTQGMVPCLPGRAKNYRFDRFRVGRMVRATSGVAWMVLWCFKCRAKRTHVETHRGWVCSDPFCLSLTVPR